MTRRFSYIAAIVVLFWLTVGLRPCFGVPRYVIPCPRDLAARSLAVLESQVGVQEATGRNDGPQVETYLRAVFLGPGNPWCCALQVWTLLVSLRQGESLPVMRTGLVSALTNDAIRKGVLRASRPNRGDLLCWKYSGIPSGHIARIDSVGKAGWVTTIEGNTSPQGGNQREGQGCYRKKRNINHPLGRMYARALIGLGDES